MKEEEIEFCERYLVLYMRILELACVNMKDWQVFMYVAGNTCKKLSIFLQLLIRKNVQCCDWDKLLNALRRAWYSSVDRNTQFFKTVTFYEKQLCREYFANEKPPAFQSILKLYSYFNLETIPTKVDPQLSKTPLEIAPRYFVHDFFNSYFSVVFDVVRENLALLQTKHSTYDKLSYFYVIVKGYMIECIGVQCLLQDPTNNIPKALVPKILKEMLTWFLSLSSCYEHFLKAQYEAFDPKNHQVVNSKDCASSSNSSSSADRCNIEYKAIPLELENAFGALNLNDATEMDKFNLFMNEYHVPLTKITHTIGKFVDGIKTAISSSLYKSCTSNRRKRTQGETNSSETPTTPQEEIIVDSKKPKHG